MQMAVQGAVTVEFKIAPGHSEKSIPPGMDYFIANRLFNAGLDGHFDARLTTRRAHTTGAEKNVFRGIRVEGNSVLIVAKPGNNETKRYVYLMPANHDPNAVLEAINAGLGGGEDGNPPPPPPPPAIWFPTDETAIALYLTELKPLAWRGGEAGYFLYGPAKKVLSRLVNKPRRSQCSEILDWLIGQGYLTGSTRETKAGTWLEYRLTALAEEVLKLAEGAGANPPEEKKEAATTAKSVIQWGAEIGQLAQELEPFEDQLKGLRKLQKERKQLEKDLEAKQAEIEQATAGLPEGVCEKYARLIAIARKMQGNGS